MMVERLMSPGESLMFLITGLRIRETSCPA